MNSTAWRDRQTSYYATHDRRCAFCGATDDIELHHHTYVRLGRELDADLLPLCPTHHAEVHTHHTEHDVTLTAATRAVAARYGVAIVRRREPGRKARNQQRKARRQARIEAQREAAR
ncbi:hypothetical protein LV457_02735 [Mycobacterium sp. MYCO198283]|uniref:hypothetical protein n=1 Tax=Mycobacterium sp. MYCO198283 TaxID=2883505 RepID=UPI001E444A27|nr:hypothetical protein [Mycobacterium sp. MYCO198283]MCG5431206.1 hypothetical protein [Mycobacterium sp. MYCO198283]